MNTQFTTIQQEHYDAIANFIDWYWSNETRRDDVKKSALEYLREDHTYQKGEANYPNDEGAVPVSVETIPKSRFFIYTDDEDNCATTQLFWQCECDTSNGLHSKITPVCTVCGSWHSASPDARVSDVVDYLNDQLTSLEESCSCEYEWSLIRDELTKTYLKVIRGDIPLRWKAKKGEER